MSPIELSLVQVAGLVAIAPICAGIGNTVRTAIAKKAFVMPFVSYQRFASPFTAFGLGAAIVFAAILPVFGTQTLAAVDGALFTVIGLLALIGGVSLYVGGNRAWVHGLIGVALGLLGYSMFSGTVLLGTLPSLWESHDVSLILGFVAMVFGGWWLVMSRDQSKNDADITMLVNASVIAMVGVLAYPGYRILEGTVASGVHIAVALIALWIRVIGIAVVYALVAELLARVPRFQSRWIMQASVLFGVASILATLWSLT